MDGTLIEGNNTDGLKEFKEWISNNKSGKWFLVWPVAGTRLITEQAFKEYDLPKPDILICSAGSEIYYTEKFIPDKGWESHIDYQWKRNELEKALSCFPGIHLQEPDAQWRFKLSYYVNESF